MKKIKLFFDTTLLLNNAGGMTVSAKSPAPQESTVIVRRLLQKDISGFYASA